MRRSIVTDLIRRKPIKWVGIVISRAEYGSNSKEKRLDQEMRLNGQRARIPIPQVKASEISRENREG